MSGHRCMSGLRVSLALVVLMVGTLLLATACGNSTNTPVGQELKQNREKWEAQKITDYEYRLKITSFSPVEITSPVIVRVVNGKTQSVKYADNGTEATDEFLLRATSVEKLFAIIDDAIKRDAAEILVTYDAARGYPTRIRIDYIKLAIDDEVTYEILDFKTLK